MNAPLRTTLREMSTGEVVTLHDGQAVTTTVAIAAGTGVSHEAVIKLVRSYRADMEEFGLVRFEIGARSTGQHGGGDVEYAILNEEQSALVLSYMRNNDIVRQFKKSLIREFFKMRSQLGAPSLPNFADPAAAARAWADEVDAKQVAVAKVAQLQHQVAEQAPAVAGLERIANAAGTMCISDAAKVLQIQPSKLTDLLLAKKWMYHRPGKPGYLAYQDRLQSGNLKHKLGSYTDPDTGDSKVKEQVLVTRKGLTNLAKIIAIDAAEKKLAEATSQHQQNLGLDPE